MCLGPEDPAQKVIDAYDQGRPTEGHRRAGTLPWRGDGNRDALLLAPDPYSAISCKTLLDWQDTYADWWRDVRNVALERSLPRTDSTGELAAVLNLAMEHTRRTIGMAEMPGWVDVAERAIAASKVRQ